VMRGLCMRERGGRGKIGLGESGRGQLVVDGELVLAGVKVACDGKGTAKYQEL